MPTNYLKCDSEYTLLFKRHYQEIITFTKDALNWSKMTVKTYTLLQVLFQINAGLLNFLFNKAYWEMYNFPPKYEASVQNGQYFFSEHQISIRMITF